MKTYGYVIEMRKTSPFYPGFYQGNVLYAGPLRSAEVYSQYIAYTLRWDDEMVRRVELFKNGKPKRIIPRK